MLKKYKVKTIELGVQSTNDYILSKCKRGHTFEDVKKASKLIRRYGFVLGHQVMCGLPESTKLDEINTAKDLIKLKPKIVRIYPVLVIKNTKLAEQYEKEEYEPLTVNQAVERCKELSYMFNKARIKVIRVGLQNTDNITNPEEDGSDVVAGPYHPAFGQLVEASMWYDSIVDEIKKVNAKVMEVEVLVRGEDINNVIGHKKENIEKLKEIYDSVFFDEKIVSISIGTRSDCVDNEKLDLISTYKVPWIEYGLQSAHDETLKWMNRGHDFECFKNAVTETKKRGIKVCAHIILGFPNETKSMMLETAKKLAELEIDTIFSSKNTLS